MANVFLYGELGKVFGTEHSFHVRKPIDAVRALMANKKGFKKAVRTWGMEGKFYEIICDGELMDSESSLSKDRDVEEIHIVPAIVGSSNAGKIIVGAVMIVASFYTGGLLGQFLFAAGASLVLGGVMGLLFPPPVPTFESDAQAKSFLFSSLENSTVQGAVVPLGYGRLRVGSKVISTSLEPQKMGDSGGSLSNFENIGDAALGLGSNYYPHGNFILYSPSNTFGQSWTLTNFIRQDQEVSLTEENQD